MGKNLDILDSLPYYSYLLRKNKQTVMDNENPKIGVEYTENAVLATLTDEKILEQADIEALEASIMPLVKQAGKINMVISFADVKFLTSKNESFYSIEKARNLLNYKPVHSDLISKIENVLHIK